MPMLERTGFALAFDGLILFAPMNQMLVAALELAWVLLLALERGEEGE
jgi:hypothetical protein